MLGLDAWLISLGLVIEHIIKKNCVVAQNRINVSWYAQAILKRNKPWKNKPATTAFGHRHT